MVTVSEFVTQNHIIGTLVVMMSVLPNSILLMLVSSSVLLVTLNKAMNVFIMPENVHKINSSTQLPTLASTVDCHVLLVSHLP